MANDLRRHSERVCGSTRSVKLKPGLREVDRKRRRLRHHCRERCHGDLREAPTIAFSAISFDFELRVHSRCRERERSEDQTHNDTGPERETRCHWSRYGAVESNHRYVVFNKNISTTGKNNVVNLE